jgi:uncharacterized protein
VPRDRGRVLLISAAVVLLLVIVSARFMANFYVDYLWHQSLGRTDVFWGVLRSKLWMLFLFGGAFIVPAVLNLLVADRLAPLEFSANTHPVVERFHELFGRRMRSLRIGVAIGLGVLFAAPAVGQWQNWLLFRNAQGFGINDPEFGNDIAFYTSRLPFMTFVIDWLFAALLIITALVVATHVLNGGIVLQPPRPKVRRATKAHIAVLLAVLALVKAVDYWLLRYELTTEQRGIVRGATYAVANAQLPAAVLLTLIAVLAAALFLVTLRTNSWRWPATVCALWAVVAVVGGVIYPAAVQRLYVNANQQEAETQYIDRNITATRQALGIDKVTVQDVEVGSITTTAVEQNAESLRNVRLVDPTEMLRRFVVDLGVQDGVAINDLDVDRYEIDGVERQVVVGARELDLDTIVNKGWQGRHLISTHGCGVVAAPAGRITASGGPEYMQLAELERPELYFSENISGYAIVGTSATEQPCINQDNAGQYQGEGGVELNSTLRRAAYALHFLDYNLVGSGAIEDESRIFTVRSVEERVRKLAPFLRYDSDPYPVIAGGRVQWVIDAYTTSNRYPYGQSASTGQLRPNSGLNEPLNYVRNSVKAVVDGYDGTVSFYVVDPTDPMIQVWQDTFPDLFLPMDQMPLEIREHLRYPEDLFRLQSAAYGKYRLTAQEFFGESSRAWSVAGEPPSQVDQGAPQTTGTGTPPTTTATGGNQDLLAADDTSERFEPYYSMFAAPGQTEASFQLFRPFNPFSSNSRFPTLSGYLTVGSDTDNYGQLTAYNMVRSSTQPGPISAFNSMVGDTDINREISLLSGRDSVLRYGTMQFVPVGDSFLWILPIYLKASNDQPASVRLVLAVNGERAAFGDNLSQAIANLFPSADLDIGEVAGQPEEGEGTEPPPANSAATAEELLAQAEDAFEAADQALADQNLALYQEKIAEGRALAKQALDLLEQP